MSGLRFRFLVLLAVTVVAAACDRTPPDIVGSVTNETPNESTPLVRVVSFTTSEPALVTADVSDGTRHRTVRTPEDLQTSHVIPIVGMYPGRSHTVTLALRDEAGNERGDAATVTFDSPALPDQFPPIQLVASDPSRMEPSLTLFSVFRWLPNRPSNDGLLVAVDERGDVVWYYQTDRRIDDVRQTSRGTLLCQSGRGPFELDALGNVIASWQATGLEDQVSDGAVPVETDTMHHELFELPSGELVTLGTEVRSFEDYPTSETDPGAPRAAANVVGDLVLQFRPDGSISKNWKLLDILDPYRIGYRSLWGFYDHTDYRHVVGGTKDWGHANAVIHDPSDDSLIVSVRHQDVLVKIDRETGRIIWMLGDPAGWSEPWRQYLLTPDGQPFEWSYHTHSPMLTPEGTLLLYDNGNYKALPFAKPVEAADNYSRVVEYVIDEVAKTVRQVWTYGGPGSDMSYTVFLGDANWLPQTGNVLVTEGGHVVDEQGVPLSDPNEGRKWSRIVEVTHTSAPEKVFELLVGGEETPGWTVYRSARLDRLN